MNDDDKIEDAEPAYEEDNLGTMMDLDITKLNINPQVKAPPKPIIQEKEEESVEELLKKRKSIVGRITGIFKK